MKKLYTGFLTLAICLTAACDGCVMTQAKANTKYDYSYKDSSGKVVTGRVETNEYGQAVIPGVPDGVDCSSLTFTVDDRQASPEAPIE